MQTPKFLKFERNGHVLYWLGIEHTRDNEHPQFKDIGRKWIEFLELVHSPVIITEHLGGGLFTTEAESIQKGGEVGFMKFLADKRGVPMRCLEPDRHDEMNHLAKLFGREKTEYYYFGRTVAQWHRVVCDKGVDEYLIQFLKRDENAADWLDFDFTIDHLKQIHKTLFGNELNLNDKKWFSKIENPTNEENPLKDVVRTSGVYRDTAVIESVKSIWKDNDIFMVYGNCHRDAHEVGLRS